MNMRSYDSGLHDKGIYMSPSLQTFLHRGDFLGISENLNTLLDEIPNLS